MTATGAGRPVDLLAPAAQLALAVARRDAASADAPPPPARLRPFLSFRHPLPARAVAAALDLLDEDEAFRERVVEVWQESGAAEDHRAGGTATDDGSMDAVRAFLLRPTGWEEDLAAAAGRSASAARAREEEAAERAAGRRVAQLEAGLARARTEADGLRARLEEERSVRRAAEERAAQVERDLAAVRDELAATEGRRARAVQDLAAARSLAEERLQEVRELRAAASAAGAASEPDAELRQGPRTEPDGSDPPPGTVGPDLTAASELLARAARVAAELRALVLEAAEGLGVDAAVVDAAVVDAAVVDVAVVDAAVVDVAAPEAPPGVHQDGAGPGRGGRRGAGARAARPRRSPVGLRRGVLADTAAAVDQLLRVPRMVAVVDGYNVSMAGWPALDHGGQREQLLRLLSEVVARTGAEVHVVFDGDADGRRPSVFAPMPVRVHFSAAGVEADDVVLDLVGRLPVDRPVLVVSSDRAVRDGAARRGADTTSSGSLLDWWRR